MTRIPLSLAFSRRKGTSLFRIYLEAKKAGLTSKTAALVFAKLVGCADANPVLSQCLYPTGTNLVLNSEWRKLLQETVQPPLARGSLDPLSLWA